MENSRTEDARGPPREFIVSGVKYCLNEHRPALRYQCLHQEARPSPCDSCEVQKNPVLQVQDPPAPISTFTNPVTDLTERGIAVPPSTGLPGDGKAGEPVRTGLKPGEKNLVIKGLTCNMINRVCPALHHEHHKDDGIHETIFSFMSEHSIDIGDKRLDQVDLFDKLEEVVDACCKQEITCPRCKLKISVNRGGFEWDANESATIRHFKCSACELDCMLHLNALHITDKPISCPLEDCTSKWSEVKKNG